MIKPSDFGISPFFTIRMLTPPYRDNKVSHTVLHYVNWLGSSSMQFMSTSCKANNLTHKKTCSSATPNIFEVHYR